MTAVWKVSEMFKYIQLRHHSPKMRRKPSYAVEFCPVAFVNPFLAMLLL